MDENWKKAFDELLELSSKKIAALQYEKENAESQLNNAKIELAKFKKNKK